MLPFVFVGPNLTRCRKHAFKSNLNRLAVTFKRPVRGIHNRTAGIIFDIIECLIQRNLSYATSDVRIAYKLLKKVLYDRSKSKVVLILHSQGGIQGGLVIDWLLQEMPQDLLAKLEVYTFGNAANHFNNPHRHIFGESLARDDPDAHVTTSLTQTGPAPSVSQVQPMNGSSPPKLAKEASSSASSAAEDRAIGHIEHYAHSTDFVALWGVLHFATNKPNSPQIPRFLGRLFIRSSGQGGHLLNQHYLDGMFPLKRDPHTGKLVGADEENGFMEEAIKILKQPTGVDDDETFDITYRGTQGLDSSMPSLPQLTEYDVETGKGTTRTHLKVRDFSRLWSYRNGQSPGRSAPQPLVDDGPAYNATA